MTIADPELTFTNGSVRVSFISNDQRDTILTTEPHTFVSSTHVLKANVSIPDNIPEGQYDVHLYETIPNGFEKVQENAFRINISPWIKKGDDIINPSAQVMKMSSSGRRVIIGIPGFNFWQGRVKAFEWNGEEWIQIGNDMIGEHTREHFGEMLAISADGNRIVIGAPHYNNTGRIKVFDWNGTDWVQIGNAIVGEVNREGFGRYIAISPDGESIAVGSPNRNGYFVGNIKVFRWNGANWEQKGDDIASINRVEGLGKALALSSDGNRIVIGGPDYNNFSGIARVFDWNGTSWEQVGGGIIGKFASSLMGTSVAISADGQRIALGMPGYKGGFLVFDWNGMSWTSSGRRC